MRAEHNTEANTVNYGVRCWGDETNQVEWSKLNEDTRHSTWDIEHKINVHCAAVSSDGKNKT